MEKKKDKIGVINDSTDFLPKVSSRLKDSVFTPNPVKNIRKKFSEINTFYPESDINIFNKFMSNDSSPGFQLKNISEEKKNPLHLPVLSKKETKKEITVAVTDYKSPILSPSFIGVELDRKVDEKPSPYIAENPKATRLVVENPKVSKIIEVYNPDQLKRGSSASRGYKSKKPRKISKYSSKQREANLDVLLMNRNNSDLSYLMQEYVRRQGLSENSKIFILTGQHDFMRRALKRLGWIENKNFNSQAYHLKWCYNDSDYDYKNLKPGQLYNHFPNNRELTTKSGLSKNLRNITDFKVNIDKFFPRSYDLGENSQIKELIEDYNRTAILNLLKKSSKGYFIDKEILTSAINYAEDIIFNMKSMCEKKTGLNDIKKSDILKILDYQVKYKGNIDQSLYFKVLDVLNQLKNTFPQFEMEGEENIWIIKPGQNSRGSGVRCVRSLQEILDSGIQMQSRIVQKYTESPLLVPLSIGMCKFDMRIWVLVTSFDPINIYFYNTSYCRLCQEPYSLDSLDPYKHLANYSIQKHIAKVQTETVWSLSSLVVYLNSLNASWLDILKQIHYIIIQTLLSVSDCLESKTDCFEVYGFDIIIDSSFRPWLLEVNLSPACSERTDWLVETLDSMADGLLNIVLNQAFYEPIYDKSLNVVRDIVGNTQEWVLLYRGENTGEELFMTKTSLEVHGEKFNVKREKNNEKRYIMYKAIVFIQYHARKFLVRLRRRKRKMNCNVLRLQNIIRRKIAYGVYYQRLELLSAVVIQKNWRMARAVKALAQLKVLRDVEIIQAMLRSFHTRKEFRKLKAIRSCCYIQIAFKRKLAYNIVKSKIYYLSCVKTIQFYYKYRFKTLNRRSIIIQKHWRGHLGRLKFRKQKLFQLSVLNIQKAIRKYLSALEKDCRKQSKAKTIISKFIKHKTSLQSLNYFYQYKSAVVIQKHWRMFAAVKLLQKMKNHKKNFVLSLCHIQKTIRGISQRKKFEGLKRIKAAIMIQKNYRVYRCKKYYRILKTVHKSALIIQKYFRGYKSRRKFAMMKRVFHQELKKRENYIKKKKDNHNRAIKASERLFKSRGATDKVPKEYCEPERPITDYKKSKVQRMKSIYARRDEVYYYTQSNEEKSALVKDIIEQLKPAKKHRSKTRKNNFRVM
jgi:Tubulin-tyrosine ligase family/IQ calmodulin-binding motif